MKILILYQDVHSGPLIAIENIIRIYRQLYPQDKLVVYKQRQSSYTGRFSFTYRFIWSIFDFWRIIVTMPALDVIYTTTYHSTIAYLFSFKMKARLVLHVHGFQTFSYSKKNSDTLRDFHKKLLGSLVHLFEKISLILAKKIIFVSSSACHIYLKCFKLKSYMFKSHIIPNGVDMRVFFQVKKVEKRKLKNHLGIRYKYIIMYVGRIDRKKGIDLFIDSLKFLKTKNIATLIVYANNFDQFSLNYFRQLQKSISKIGQPDVHFIKSPSHIADYYKVADCLVLPSHEEMMPLVILEALAAKVSIASFDVGNVKQILGSLSKYYVLTDHTPRALAAKIDQLLTLSIDNKNFLHTQGIRIAEKYSWENSVNLLRRTFTS